MRCFSWADFHFLVFINISMNPVLNVMAIAVVRNLQKSAAVPRTASIEKLINWNNINWNNKDANILQQHMFLSQIHSKSNTMTAVKRHRLLLLLFDRQQIVVGLGLKCDFLLRRDVTMAYKQS